MGYFRKSVDVGDWIETRLLTENQMEILFLGYGIYDYIIYYLIRLWTQNQIKILFILWGIMHVASFWKVWTLVVEIRLWTQTIMKFLFALYRIKPFGFFLKSVDVGNWNPVMDSKHIENLVCGMRNNSFCYLFNSVDVCVWIQLWTQNLLNILFVVYGINVLLFFEKCGCWCLKSVYGHTTRLQFCLWYTE